MIKYAIIENECLALDLMKALVKRVRPEWELVFTAPTVAEAINFFSSGHEADLCFMDIELNDGDCFEIFGEVEIGIPIIFTTAYDEFLLRAFKVNSVDYLLKPIMEQDVAQAILKYERFHAKRGSENSMRYQPLYELSGKRSEASSPVRILTVSGDNYSFVPIGKVAWLVSEEKYVYVVDTDGNRRLTAFETLGEAGEILNGDSFFFLRRNLICSPEAIKGVKKYFKGRLKVYLQSGGHELEIVVSSDRRQQFLSWLGGK